MVQAVGAELLAAITEERIDLNAIMRHGVNPPALSQVGARVLFSGEIRGTNHGADVVRLEYTAHKILAEKHMRQVLEDAARKYPLIAAMVIHRIGMLEVSECAVAVLTCGRHRRETYAANQYVIDRVKAETPIWKREFFADGSSKWGENCH
ncbi:MAG: molybdenum cofactor biosynthesis protein MoaE [Turneriella sp.]